VLRNNSRKVQLSFVVSNDILLQCTVIWKCHYAYIIRDLGFQFVHRPISEQ